MKEHREWRKANKKENNKENKNPWGAVVRTRHVEYAHADKSWHEEIRKIREEMDKLTEKLSYYLDKRAESHYHNVAVEVLNAKDPNELARLAAKWDD